MPPKDISTIISSPTFLQAPYTPMRDRPVLDTTCRETKRALTISMPRIGRRLPRLWWEYREN